MRPVLYLANDLGFSGLGKIALNQVKQKLTSAGFEVWEPFERNGNLQEPFEIAKKNLEDLRQCDAVFAILNGVAADDGIAVEIGYAMALEKPLFIYRDDFRQGGDFEEYPLNIMLFAGLPQANWQDYYYTNQDELSHPDKALARFKRQKALLT